MKLRKFGQAVLALVVGIGLSFGLTSCVQSHSIGYFYVTLDTAAGQPSGQVIGYKINNNTGNLSLISGTPVGSGGLNPVDAVVTQGGRFLYVLNAGCADPAVYPNAKFLCPSGTPATASNISLFTIGGSGTLSFQANYFSQGNNSVTITTDSTGSFLYVLDQNVPDTATIPTQYQADGDVSAYSIDGNTGRLQLIQNQQVTDTTGARLNFFPVGQAPVWFAVYNSYLFTIDRDQGEVPNAAFVSVYSAPSTGQLVATQNSEFPTGATDLTYVYGKGSYLFLLDAGHPGNTAYPDYAGAIFNYTVGTNGALASVTGGAQYQASSALQYTVAVNPDAMTLESGGKFLYVANSGLNTGISSPGSIIASYVLNANGTLAPVGGVNGGTVNSSVGAGPRCILEDPSNQFLFTANYNDSTISGFIINTEAGVLTLQSHNATTKGLPGNPTWCVASGTTF